MEANTFFRRGGFALVAMILLAPSMTGATAAAEFTAANFYWDADTKNHKELIIKVVNRLHREDARCRDTIHPGTASKSLSRSKAANRPVFFVHCGEGTEIVTVYFDGASADNEAPLQAPVHADQSAAVQACEDYVKSRALHPATVIFSRFFDLAVSEHPNGRTTVLSVFTAKNSLDLEFKYTVRCLLDQSGLIEGNINEAL